MNNDRKAKLAYVRGQILTAELWARYHMTQASLGRTDSLKAAKAHIYRINELLDTQDDLIRGNDND